MGSGLALAGGIPECTRLGKRTRLLPSAAGTQLVAVHLSVTNSNFPGRLRSLGARG